MSDYQNRMTKADLVQLFKEKGITVTIWGCGCCGSPIVTVTSEGRIFDGEDVNINMHEQLKGQDNE